MTLNSIPSEIPAEQIDNMFAAYRKITDLQMHWVIEFEGRVDKDKLQKAIRLSIDAEPILGCFLKKSWNKQKWIRHSEEKLNNSFYFKETKDIEKDLIAFKTAEYDLYKDPAFKAILIRGDRDTACFMFSHAALDGGGTKEYFRLLGSIYNKLTQDPTYQPDINVDGERDLHQVTKSFSAKERLGHIKLVFSDYIASLYPFKSWQYTTLGTSIDSKPTYISHKIDSKLILEVKKYALNNNFTLTDALMAAVYRALHTQIQPTKGTALKLGTTVDLRPYLKRKRGGALCNLSAAFDLNIGTDIGDTFSSTAMIVKTAMDKHKQHDIGMGDRRYAIFDLKFLPFIAVKNIDKCYRILKFLVGPKKIAPLLALVGKLDGSVRLFKDVKIDRVYSSSPLPISPIFFICLTAYNNTYTLCSGFKGSAEDERLVNDLFLLIEKELSDAVTFSPEPEKEALAEV